MARTMARYFAVGLTAPIISHLILILIVRKYTMPEIGRGLPSNFWPWFLPGTIQVTWLIHSKHGVFLTFCTRHKIFGFSNNFSVNFITQVLVTDILINCSVDQFNKRVNWVTLARIAETIICWYYSEIDMLFYIL